MNSITLKLQRTRKIILAAFLLITSGYSLHASGGATLTNNLSIPINVVFYGSNYTPLIPPVIATAAIPANGTTAAIPAVAGAIGTSPKGRLTPQGVQITAGQNISIPSSTSVIGVFSIDDSIYQAITNNQSYTISANRKNGLMITQDQP